MHHRLKERRGRAPQPTIEFIVATVKESMQIWVKTCARASTSACVYQCIRSIAKRSSSKTLTAMSTKARPKCVYGYLRGVHHVEKCKAEKSCHALVTIAHSRN